MANKENIHEKQKRESERKARKLVQGSGDWARRCRATNWNPGGNIPQSKRPYLLGEGIGNRMGLDGPKYTQTSTAISRIEEGNEAYQKELREERSQRRAVLREAKASLKEILKRNEQSGMALVDQRIFYLEYPNKDWEKRSKVFGGLPENIDVALSDFGMLLLVPVVEEAEAKEQGFNKKVPGTKQRRDSQGRAFWVAAELKEVLTNIFGYVRWSRPITIKEAVQFGITIV